MSDEKNQEYLNYQTYRITRLISQLLSEKNIFSNKKIKTIEDLAEELKYIVTNGLLIYNNKSKEMPRDDLEEFLSAVHWVEVAKTVNEKFRVIK